MRELKQFPDQFLKLAIERRLTENEMSKIRKGKAASSMDDRWVIYYKDSFLYFHRSWTGSCIYKAKVIENEGLARMVEVFVNANINDYKYSNESEESMLFVELLDRFLQDKL